MSWTCFLFPIQSCCPFDNLIVIWNNDTKVYFFSNFSTANYVGHPNHDRFCSDTKLIELHTKVKHLLYTKPFPTVNKQLIIGIRNYILLNSNQIETPFVKCCDQILPKNLGEKSVLLSAFCNKYTSWMTSVRALIMHICAIQIQFVCLWNGLDPFLAPTKWILFKSLFVEVN